MSRSSIDPADRHGGGGLNESERGGWDHVDAVDGLEVLIEKGVSPGGGSPRGESGPLRSGGRIATERRDLDDRSRTLGRRGQ